MRRIVHSLCASAFALALISGPPVAADQADPILDVLFAKLQKATQPAEIHSVTRGIWQVWARSDDEQVNELMQAGIIALNQGAMSLAIAAFDAVVETAPDFAEGWNKRATVRFLVGDFAGSIADIERTLALEPRHFGALSGLGMIMMAEERPKEALKAYEAALAVNPHLPQARAVTKRLRQELEGAPI